MTFERILVTGVAALSLAGGAFLMPEPASAAMRGGFGGGGMHGGSGGMRGFGGGGRGFAARGLSCAGYFA